MNRSPHIPWDGENEEGTVSRPGYKWPWVYVLQRDGDRVVWGVYSQQATYPRARGVASTADQARKAAIGAARDLKPTG